MQYTLSAVIDLYQSYLQYEKNASPKTRENYALWLRRFVEFHGDHPVESIKPLHVLNFRKHLDVDLGLSVKTINYHIVALRALLKFLIKNDIPALAPDKIELAKTPPRTISYLTEAEVELMLSAPERFASKPEIKLRDTAIIYTLYGSGVRVSELIAMTREMIPQSGNQIQIIGK